jgi:hypothetical protein
MLHLNETINCLDPAEALSNEYGVFEAISPNGERLQFVCRPGHSITNIRTESKPEQPQVWRLKKVAELRTEQATA